MALEQRSNCEQFRDLVHTFKVSWGPLPSIAPHINDAPGLSTGMVLLTLSCREKAIGELETELSEATGKVERWRSFQGPADDLIDSLSDMLIGSEHVHGGTLLKAGPVGSAADYQQYAKNALRAAQALIDENTVLKTVLKEGSATPVETAMRILVDRAYENAAEAWNADVEGEEGMAEWSDLNQRPRDRLMMPQLISMCEEWVRYGHHLERPEPEKQSVFDPDTVVKLEENQTADQFHPYTCANRNDGHHREMLGDLGALVPTVRGWICPFCDYTQGWAHGLPSGEVTTKNAFITTPCASQPDQIEAPVQRHMIEAAAEIVAMHDRPSTSLISHKMGISHFQAVAVMDKLVVEGVVSEPNDVGKRTVLDYSALETSAGFRKLMECKLKGDAE